MNRKTHSGIPVAVGIVGCGGIAQVFHLPILARHPDVQIRAVCDTDTSKASVVAGKFNIPAVYADIAEMLDKEKLELVFILTPNNLHLPMSLIALERGTHLFLEKPAARTSEEAKRIQQKAKEVGKSVMVGMQNRFRPDVQAMQRFLAEEELDSVFHIKALWLQASMHSIRQPWLFKKKISGGGVMLDLGVQLIDLVWMLLNKPKAVSVKAFAHKISDQVHVEDSCVACLSFENGVSVALEMSWDFPISQDRFQVEVVGKNGTGTLNPLQLNKMWHGQIVRISPELPGNSVAHFKQGYRKEVSALLDFLTGRTGTLAASIDDAVEVLKIVDGMYKSIETGREVVL